MLSIRAFFVAGIAVCAMLSANAQSNPWDIEFKRVWEGRNIFDAEMPFPKDVKFLPVAHYSAEVTAPTCTEKGYTKCTCASCGHSYLSNLVPAIGHDYVSEVIDPTTKAQGYTQHTCSRCGDTYKDNYTERLPVAYRYGTVELPPVPEYDTTAYPYAFITESSSGTTYFYYSNQPLHGYSSVMDLITNTTVATLGTFKISDGAWIVGTAPQEYAAKVVATNIPFWANYTVLDVHEQIWCKKSDPEPIYE